MADLNNVLVLTVFVASVVAVIVGYLLAWRAKRNLYRSAGSMITAAVAGFAGLVMLAWLLGAIMPIPPPDGSPIWKPLIFFLAFLPLPLSAFYICAKFIRRARGGERNRT